MRTAIQPGSPVSGNMAPERKKAGWTMKFTTNWKPIIDSIRAATATPTEVRAKDRQKISPISSSTASGVRRTPTSGASTSRTSPCTVAWVAPPSAFPIATAERSMGATSTSRRKPNSRSQTIDMALNTEVKRTAMPMIPGYMNCW